MPSIETSSFNRDAAESGCAKQTANRMGSIRMGLERKQPQEQAVQEEGAFDRVSHYTLSVDPDFHLGDAVGRDRVIRRQVDGTDDAAHGDRLVLGVDLELFRAFQDEVSIR